MNSLRTQAIVLRRTNYGEADRIVQLITPDGRMAVMARGVRKERSRLAGGIELFAVSDVVIHQGKGEFGILTSARMMQFYRHILEDYDRLQFAYEVLKQVGKASELVDEPEWYHVTFEIIKALDVSTISLQLVQTWFYLRYSALLGHELPLNRDVEGNPLDKDARYNYDVAEKGLRVSVNGALTSDHIKLLRLMAVKDISVLVQVGGVSEVLATCHDTTRAHAALS